MTTFVVIVFACIFIAFTVFALKETGYLRVALKSGGTCFLILLIASFIYGIFNRFSFMHGSSRAGLESAMAYMMLLGMSVGPVLFFVGGLCGAVISYFRKKGNNKSRI